MKILMVTADHLMIDRRILQEAATLIAQGYEVTLLAGFECPKTEAYVQDGKEREFGTAASNLRCSTPPRMNPNR